MSDAATHIDRVGLRKLGNPHGFAFFAYETTADGSFLLSGGVYKVLQRGPNKGRKSWRGCAVSKVVVTKDEVRAEERRFAADTGKCHRCMGDGRVMKRWSVANGVEHKECDRCAGSGVAGLLTSGDDGEPEE
jgi:hypothetical protein